MSKSSSFHSVPIPGRLASPMDLDNLVAAVRRPTGIPNLRFGALFRIQLELQLREVWIEVHQAAGSVDRAEALVAECSVLRDELRTVNDFYFGRRLENHSPVEA